MILNVESLSFSYQYLQLFRNLSFQVLPGQLMHFKGANGSGKTTLLEIIAGLRCLQKGDVYLESQASVLSLALKEHSVYLCAETNGLYGQLTAIENFCFWERLRGLNLTLSRVKEDLARWGFEKDFFLNYLTVNKFSKGMKRRLSLARVFSSDATVLLLDEPTAGLDEEGSVIFTKAIERSKQEKKIILLVSHDVRDIKHLVDKTLHLEKIGK